MFRVDGEDELIVEDLAPLEGGLAPPGADEPELQPPVQDELGDVLGAGDLDGDRDVRVEGLHDPFPAVFIRAPVIDRVWGDCRPLSRYEGRIVMAAQKNMLAVSFHPELSGDTRIHEMLIQMGI